MSELLPNLEEQKHAFIIEQVRDVYGMFKNPSDFLITTANLEDYAPHVAELGLISNFIASDPRLENEEPNEGMKAVNAFAEGGMLGLVVAWCYLNDVEFESMPLALESIRFSIGQGLEDKDVASQNEIIKNAILLVVNDGEELAHYYQALTMDYFNCSDIDEKHVEEFCNGFEYIMAVVTLIKRATAQHNSELLESASQLLAANSFEGVDAGKVELN